MRIFIEPTEPLIFRTGRPFTAGENTFAESNFPPTPETLQGALRAAIAVQWGQTQNPPLGNLASIFEKEALEKLIGKRSGERDTYGQFRITGLTLGRRQSLTSKIERLFPPPSHIIQATLEDASKRKIQPLVFLQPKKQKSGTTNISSDYQLLFPQLGGCKTVGKSEALTSWLTPRGLSSILQGDLPNESDECIVKISNIYTHESRLGIGMNNDSKTTKEGYLYQVQMIRMQPSYGFVIDIAFGEQQYGDHAVSPEHEHHADVSQELSFLNTGWMTLGGEQRAAHFTVLTPQDIVEEGGISQMQPGNLLYFATPSYFEQGWLPHDSKVLSAQPITAAINRYQPIGGWYLNPQNAGGGGKIMRRCVPAGSVYFFDQKIVVNRPLTDYGWQIGYGITYTGEWK